MSDRTDPPSGDSEDSEDHRGPGDGLQTSGGPDRRAWIVVGVLAVVVVILAIWLWASNDDDAEDIAGDQDSTSTTGSETTGGDSSAGSTTTTDEDGSSTTQSTLADENPGGITVPEGASTSPVSVPSPAIEPTGITAVRTARHEGFDRVVFEFDGPLPGYEVKYADGPVREDGSGAEVAVEGPFAVTVRMTPASTVRFTDDGYEEIYTGPDRVPGAGATVTEVVQAGDFEAQATWAIGLADKVDFAVSNLESPSRLVVDFVNH